MRLALAEYCDAMSDLTNDGRWRSAAAILCGGRPGRNQVDDSAALAYARALLTSGVASSCHRACSMAAKLFAPSHQIPATRDRLRKKLRTKPINSEDAGKKRA